MDIWSSIIINEFLDRLSAPTDETRESLYSLRCLRTTYHMCAHLNEGAYMHAIQAPIPLTLSETPHAGYRRWH